MEGPLDGGPAGWMVSLIERQWGRQPVQRTVVPPENFLRSVSAKILNKTS
jgi:hypothetical protein